MLLTYALTEPHQVIQVSDIINESVGDIQAGFTSKQLADAKSQVVFDYLATQANMASQMAYYIQSVQQFNAIPTMEDVTRLVDNIQMTDIQRFIKEQFQLPHEFRFNTTPLDDRTRIVR
jgi:predicted Zn-dependent peptidase